MELQSFDILSEFEKLKMNTQNGIYKNIWEAEWNVIDYINLATNTAYLLKFGGEKNEWYKVVALRAYHNVSLLATHCTISAINLNYYKDDIKVPSVKNEIAKQASYAKETCDALDNLSNAM